MKEKTYAIVLNGEKYNGNIVGDKIIGVDGGYDKVEHADIFVGDKDSVLNDVSCEKKYLLNVDKDLTDGEYAVRLAIEQGAKCINFYGLLGGRIDHVLANIGLMAICAQNNVQAVAYGNDTDIYMVDKKIEIDVQKFATISLSPFTDMVHIISLEGVKWGVFDQNIYKNSSRTMSNIATSSKIRLCVDNGLVMLIVNK